MNLIVPLLQESFISASFHLKFSSLILLLAIEERVSINRFSHYYSLICVRSESCFCNGGFSLFGSRSRAEIREKLRRMTRAFDLLILKVLRVFCSNFSGTWVMMQAVQKAHDACFNL